MTGQGSFDSYEWAGAVIAAELVNELTLDHAYGRRVDLTDPYFAIQEVLDVDPPFPPLHDDDIPGITALAGQLREVFHALHQGNVDAAAHRLNDLLAAHPAHPHLAKKDERWLLHHHPADAALVPMATAICAEGIARMVGAGNTSRLGMCSSEACDRVFLDGSKNGSRRFCSTTCQNRVKAAAFRQRQATDEDQALSRNRNRDGG